jgi:hypothetical protein
MALVGCVTYTVRNARGPGRGWPSLTLNRCAVRGFSQLVNRLLADTSVDTSALEVHRRRLHHVSLNWGNNESVGRGCCDISSVSGLLLEGAEVSDDGGVADDELRIVMSLFPRPFTMVYRCLDHAKDLPVCAISWCASRDGHIDLRRGIRSPESSATSSAACSLSLESSPWHPSCTSWRDGASPDFSASSRMSVRRSHCSLAILFVEPCPESRSESSPTATHATWYSLDLTVYGAIIGNDWVSAESARWRRRVARCLRVKDPSRSRLHDIIYC